MKRIVIALVLLVFLVAVSAQNRLGLIFKPDYYIGVNVGVNTLWAEGLGMYSKTQNAGFIGRATVGYQLSPVIGIRSFMGYASHNWYDFRFKNTDTSLKVVSFDAQMVTVDLTMNLSNWFSYYNRNWLFDFSLFAGTGITHRDKDAFSDELFSYVGRGGLQGDFHLSSSVDLSLIAEMNFTGDGYNNYKTGFPFDMYAAFTVGLSYHFRSIHKKGSFSY